MALRVAVVGCGGAGREHARAYRRLDGVELVAVCDVVGERAERLAAEVGARPYRELERMLAAERPDLVSVCTAEYQHVEPALQALAAGCHVFCEKPLAHSVAEARRLVAAAEAADRVLGVDYNYRHMPPFRALREVLAGGALGEVVLAQISAHAFCYHHALDLVRFWFGEVAEAAAWVHDVQARRQFPWRSPEEFLYVPSVSVGAVLRTAGSGGAAGGTTVLLGASRLRSLEDTLLDVEVLGSAGRVALRGLPVGDVRPRRVEVWPPSAELEARLGAARPGDPAFSLSDAFAASVAAFVAALQAGRPVPTDGRDGLAALLVDQAVVQSHRFGAVVRLGVG
jgi:UDP-N-acetylglucosamine 3-dehydrogenase